jgi:sRNA-binding regulator protein Hfq
MTRRTCITALATALAAGVAVDGKDLPMLRSLLEASKNEKKGVTLWVKGQTIGGQVTNLDTDYVELRNREFSRMVIKIESIDGAAMA